MFSGPYYKYVMNITKSIQTNKTKETKTKAINNAVVPCGSVTKSIDSTQIRK